MRTGKTPTQVFDIDTDPQETRDRAAATPRSELDDAERQILEWHERALQLYLAN